MGETPDTKTFSDRMPQLLENLRTHPGGHRRLGLFDHRIKVLWSLITRTVDRETWLTSINVTATADRLGVDRCTVRSWLEFFHRHKLVTFKDRRGGRGRGMLLDVTWLRRGALLENAFASSLSPKPSNKDLTSCPPKGGIKQTANRERHRLVGTVKKTLKDKIKDPQIAVVLTTAVGYWAFRKSAPLGELTSVAAALALPGARIPVPRWVRTARDAWRWAWGLIRKLRRWGSGWWRMLQLQRDRWRLARVETRLTAAHQAGQACPMCRRIHDRLDFEDGRDADGRLNCFGWVRVKLDDVAQDLIAERGARMVNHTRCCRCGGDLDPDARGHVCGRCTYLAQLQADAETRRPVVQTAGPVDVVEPADLAPERI